MTRPVGIFDSGFGGLTVVRHFLDLLPEESIIYFGDNARVPYGSRTQKKIQGFVLETAQYLVGRGIKALLVACNTATAAALTLLRQNFSLPIIGIIEPGAKAAVRASRSGEIAVVATEYTIASRSYQDTITRLWPQARVYGRACPLFVSFVERGRLNGRELEAAAEEYLSFLVNTDIDTLVLGCTHYPHLIGTIRRVIGPDIRIIDPAEATIREMGDLLKQKRLLAAAGSAPRHLFYTSGNPEHFRRLGQQLLAFPMEQVEQVAVGE